MMNEEEIYEEEYNKAKKEIEAEKQKKRIAEIKQKARQEAKDGKVIPKLKKIGNFINKFT